MTDPQALALRVRRARRRVDEESGQVRALKEQLAQVREDITTLQDEIMTAERASILLTSLGEERQMKAQEAIETLVTRGLQTVFDETLSFHITQTVKGKASVVEFLVRTSHPDGRVDDTGVLDARGGGVAAVVGFLLRLVVMLLKKDDRWDKVLVLDETFAHVSDEYLPGLTDFLRQIVDKMGVQIIMVTHQPEFGEGADRVYKFTNIGDVTKVKVEK